MSFKFAPILILFCISCVSCAVIPQKPDYLTKCVSISEIRSIEEKEKRFKQQLIGHFSNKDYIMDNNHLNIREQEIIVSPILTSRKGETWLYSEQFMPQLIESPLYQQVFKIIKLEPKVYLLEVYHLQQPLAFVNAWKNPSLFDQLSIKKDLQRIGSCDLFLVADKTEEHQYITEATNSDFCPVHSESSAIKYQNIHFRLNDLGYLIKSRNYNVEKVEMTSTANKPILFKRLDYTDASYKAYATN